MDVELIWTRFERDGSEGFSIAEQEDDATLSVCLVLLWPPQALVECATDFGDAGKVLHALIGLFEELRQRGSVITARSRIEDGRFVGWLSYPSVLAAQDAFFALRETAQTRGLTVKLHTRDERIPMDSRATLDEPVMSRGA